MDFINFPILLFGLLLGGSILTSLLSSKMGIPLILIFLCIGLLVGESGLGLIPVGDNPKGIFSLGSVALALILFDSGYQTTYKSYRSAATPAILLATIGVGMTAVFLAPAVQIVMGGGFLLAFLTAAIISSTDSASVFFMLRSQGISIKERLKSTLEVESGGNDPMAIFLTFSALMLLQAPMEHPHETTVELIRFFFSQFCIGMAFGALLGYGLRFIVNKVVLELALYPIFVLALALLGFSFTNMLGGSGFLALYIAGTILGNSHIKAYTAILKFQQTLGWLSQIILFTSLGLFVNISMLQTQVVPAVLLSLFLMFVVRPVMVLLLTIGFKYSWRERLFMAFVGLRGATSILLAIAPIVMGIEQGGDVFSVIFVMVLFSLSVQGFFIPKMARWLNVQSPMSVPEPEIMQIDLPGLTDSALVMYKLTSDSAVVNGEKLPKWARPVLIIREGVSYTPGSIAHFKIDDRVYVFAPSDSRRLMLDALFGTRPQDEAISLLGDFPLSPQSTFGDLAAEYGLNIPKRLHNMTIAQLIIQEFKDIAVGDRLSLDNVELVVREVKKHLPTKIGLDIDPHHARRCRKIMNMRCHKVSAH